MAGNFSAGPVRIKSPNTRSEEESANKTGDAPQVVDNPTASKVNITSGREPPFLCPSPVNHCRVDNGRDDGAELRGMMSSGLVDSDDNHLEAKYAANSHLSARAPETMVEAVAQKTKPKNQ